MAAGTRHGAPRWSWRIAVEMLFPRHEAIEPGEIYRGLAFPEAGGDRPYVALNMVTSVDGKATLGLGAYALGSRVDHLVMRRIRLAADGVMVGAETLRTENVNPGVPPEMQEERVARGMLPQPTAVVVTSTADLPLDRTFFRSAAFPRVVVTTGRAPVARVEAVERLARVIRVGEKWVDLPEMMGILARDLGIRSLVVEGGPSLNAALMAEGLVDELFWTVAPKIVGGAARRTMVEGEAFPPDRVPRLELVSVHHHEGELFLRYRLPGRPQGR